MNNIQFHSFCIQLEKTASIWSGKAAWGAVKDMARKHGDHAAEVAGLGVLAAPSIQKLRGKKMSEKNTAKTEVAGLGILAAPSAYKLLKHAGAFDRAGRMVQQAKGIISKAPAKLKMPGSMVRGKPMTGMKMHGLDRGAMQPGTMAATATKVKAQVG